MRIEDYKRGDLVTVTIRNYKIVEDYSLWGIHNGIEHSTRPGKAMDEVYFSTYNKDITVEKIGTDDTIIPQVGDVYRASGRLWFVRKYEGRGGTVVIEDGEGGSFSDDKYNITNEIKKFQELKPKLIARDGKSVK